jgi:hypothetical protein
MRLFATAYQGGNAERVPGFARCDREVFYPVSRVERLFNRAAKFPQVGGLFLRGWVSLAATWLTPVLRIE